MTTFLERRRHRSTSITLFIFWVLMLIIVSFRFTSSIMQEWYRYTSHRVFFAYTCFQLMIAVAQVIIYGCIGGKEGKLQKKDILLAEFSTQNRSRLEESHGRSPEMSASVLSQLTFWWMTDMIIKGWRKPLKAADIYLLPPSEWSLNCRNKFTAAWDICVKTAKKVCRPSTRSKTLEVDSKTGVHSPPSRASHSTTNNDGALQSPSWILFKAMFKAFGLKFAFAGLLKLGQDSLLLLGPIFMMIITTYMKEHLSRPAWHGYLTVAAIFINSVLQTSFLAQYFYTVSIVGLRCRAALTAAIFGKCLRLSNAARQATTTGQTVNLIAVDAAHFLDTAMFLHVLWSAPLQITIALILLWINLGPATLAGLGVMVLMVVFSGFVARFAKKFQFAKMKKKDERIKLTNEMLMGMKSIKLYAWERSFQQKIEKARKEEVSFLRKSILLGCVSATVWNVAPHVVQLVTFGTYIFSDPEANLDPVKAFVSIVLFNIMRFPLIVLPNVISNVVQSTVSLKRIADYLMLEELDESSVNHGPSSHPDAAFMKNGCFTWANIDSKEQKNQENSNFSLKSINLKVKRGELIAIVGQVGCGKSSLISAFLGEMQKLDGEAELCGHCAYVAQTAWIQNATLKNNILFSSPLEEKYYQDVLEACALKPDLEILADGDETEIGEKGINLSGGQKQRIALARSVYSKSDVYLLDDPLSAVDSYTARHLFDNVIGPNGMLSKDPHGPRTRIWATHRLSFLPNCDRILFMHNGTIKAQGNFKELLEASPDFCELIRSYMQSQDADNDEALELENALEKEGESDLSRKSSVSSGIGNEDAKASKQPSTPASPKAEIETAVDILKKKKKAMKLMETEEVKEGLIKFSIFSSYFKSLGYGFVVLVIFFFIISHVFSLGAQNYLSIWTDNVVYNATAALDEKAHNFAVISVLYLAQAIAVLIATIGMAFSSIRAAVNLHAKLLTSIIHTAMVFFESTPLGRILNRFSKDVEVVDVALRETIMGFMACALNVAATFIIISIKLPVFLTIGLPLLVVYAFIQRVFVASMRQLKRIESVSRSPLLSQFGETITGVTTIRAFNRQGQFNDQFLETLDENQMATYVSQMGNRWLSVRMELIGSTIIFSTALFAVIQRNSLDPGALGLALAYAMSVSQTLNWMVRCSSEIETNIVAVERIDEYVDTAKEGEWAIPSIDDGPDMKHWPKTGEIVFENVVLRYREGLDPALRGLSFTIKPKEKVGIVGRTGAGKSSLSVALLRLVEISSGRILIDGVDISKIGVHLLRRAVTPIPQDSTLFSGTLRFNLDPYDHFNDDELKEAIKHVNLTSLLEGDSKGLDMTIAENGENLSVGQRQLVCMARALLGKPRPMKEDHVDHRFAHILLMDEATAAIDVSTDRIITEMVHREFANSTVLTIAHRLDTVISYDK